MFKWEKQKKKILHSIKAPSDWRTCADATAWKDHVIFNHVDRSWSNPWFESWLFGLLPDEVHYSRSTRGGVDMGVSTESPVVPPVYLTTSMTMTICYLLWCSACSKNIVRLFQFPRHTGCCQANAFETFKRGERFLTFGTCREALG